MKKSFMGYNPQEVDETIEYLEATNAKLEKQVKQLNAELSELQAKQKEAASEERDDQEKTRMQEQLESQCAAFRAENEQLKATVASLSAQMEASAAAQDEFKQVSEICRVAYQDMFEAKAKAKQQIQTFTEDFLTKWADYHQRVMCLSGELRKTQEESRDAFLNAADEILSKYTAIAEEGADLQTHMDEMELAETDIREQVRGILESLEDVEAASDLAAVESSQPVKEESPRYAVLRALRERDKSKEARPGLTAVPMVAEERKVATLPIREPSGAASQSDEIGISIGVNTRNIVND